MGRESDRKAGRENVRPGQLKGYDMAERKPPKHLDAAGRAYWRAVLRSYELEDHHIAILTTACEALDRAAQAREVIRKVGILIAPKSGGIVRQNPAIRVEKDAQLVFLRAQKELGLDIEQAAPMGRPPGGQ